MRKEGTEGNKGIVTTFPHVAQTFVSALCFQRAQVKTLKTISSLQKLDGIFLSSVQKLGEN